MFAAFYINLKYFKVMKPLLSSMMLLALPLFMSAQKSKADTLEPFLYLTNGTLLEKYEFKATGGLFEQKFAYANGDKINIANVKFYQDEKNYYGLTPDGFARREEKGVYDLFGVIAPDGHYCGDQYIRTSRKTHYYTTKEFGNLKPFTYENLKPDLSLFPDNSHHSEHRIILRLLEKGQRQNKNKGTRLIVGVSAMAAGLLVSAASNKAANDSFSSGTALPIGPVLMLGGLGVAVSSFAMKKPEAYYLEAFKTYNRAYYKP